MSSKHDLLPPTFNRLAWSNLAAQSAEQVALAAAPIVAVLLLGAGEGQTGLLQTALTLPFVLFAIPAGPAFGFAAALSIVAVVLLAGIFEPARQAISRRHPWQEIKEGAHFVFRHPLLRPVFVTQFIFGTAWFVILAVFVPYGIRQLGL